VKQKWNRWNDSASAAAQGTQTEEKDPVVFQEQSIFQLGGLNQIYCYPCPLALWMRVTDNV
jgi:hypothetical protein